MNNDIAARRVIGAPAGAAFVGVDGHPLLRILASFPIACFCGALMTDLVYALTADMIWADFSAWLLAVGIVVGGVAALIGIVATLRRRQSWGGRRSWIIVVGSLIVLVLALFDNFVHSRDGWTSVVPEGLMLSAVTVVVMLVTAWVGGAPIASTVVVDTTLGARR